MKGLPSLVGEWPARPGPSRNQVLQDQPQAAVMEEMTAASGDMTLRDFARSWRTVIVMVAALVMLAFIAWLDYLSEWEVSLFVFYALPILLVVWYGGSAHGIVVAVLCMLAWWWANRDGHPYQTGAGYLWATISRFVYFACVAIGGTALKKQREADHARIEALERASSLERDIVNVSEHEQRRIGQDLHDGLCQELAGIGCAVTMLKDELHAKSLPEAVAAEEIEGYIRDAGTRARDLARGIFPVLSENSGLESALEELAAFTSKVYHRQVDFVRDEGIQVARPEVAMHLYRIAQEAIGNALKHGRAQHVVISLRLQGGELHMSVEDDGCGIPSPRPRFAGMGLRTMGYRARLIGARLEVEPGTLCGTVITCRMSAAGISQPIEDHD